MCCMLTTLIFFRPRLGILVWWLISPVYVSAAFNSWLLMLLAWLMWPLTVAASTATEIRCPDTQSKITVQS